MVDPKIIKDWLEKAEEDHLYARKSLEEGFPVLCSNLFSPTPGSRKIP